MRKVIGFFIKRPIWGNALIAIIILFGVFSIFSTRRSFFPEIDPYTIVVSVFYPGASPAEMEEGVTIKVEQAVKGLPEIEEINSVSSENMASITLKAYTDTDMDELLSDVENSINSINSFPQGAERPIIRRLKSSGMGSVVAFCGISSKKENIDNMDLTDLAAKVERDLLSTKVITQVEKQGFPEKEIAINVRESDLLRYSISMQEVSAAISSKNLDITTGMIRGGMQEMNIRSNSKGVTDESIGQIILRTSTTGEKIRIADVADVVTGYSEASQESRFNGMPAVSFRIEKTVDQDIAKITAALHDYKEKFNAANPGYQFNIFFEFNSMLNQRIDLLTSNGLTGLVLVLVFLGLFLNIKLSAWVAFGIPFSFLGMFIIGLAYGISINMISLFGMILVVGILVDDGIVIAENIYTHFERGKSASQAAIDGTMEVLPSVFSSVVTTIVAFSILLFVEGLEMMREMAFVVISCLAFSLVEAFIILPAHLAHKSVLYESDKPNLSLRSGFLLMLGGIAVIVLASFVFPSGDISLGAVLFPFLLFVIGGVMVFKGFNTSPIEQAVRGGADKGIKYVRENLFRTTIDMFLGTKRKWYRLTFFFPLFFLIVTLGMFSAGVISFTFFPNIQPDFFSIEAAYRPGDNKEQTERFVEAATMVLLEENERIKKENGDTLLTYFSSNLGFSQNLGQNGNHTAAINVFYDGEKSSTPVDTLMNRIVRRLREIPEGLLAQETYVGGFNRFGKEIEIGLTSSNDKNLYLVRDDLKKRMSQIDGVINVKDNMPPGKVEVQLELLPQAEVFGLTRSDVLNQIRAGFFGLEAQRVIIGTDEVKIWVRYPQSDRRSYTDLENMRIKTPNGHAIPLNEICDFKLGRAPESLKRRNGQRIIKVDANSTDPDRVAVINTDLFNKVIPELTRSYSDVQAVKLGQFERSQKTGNSMQYISIIGIVMMFIILTLHFNSLSQAFLILLVLPAGIAGAIMGHGLVGIPVSILSVFGMIGLLGVLVNDAIVFLDRYNAVLVEGLTPREAAMEAAISRFRPILLTSLTTVAGLLPMIAEQSMQAQFLIPMATSIAFGVLFGTIFILFFYPSAILFWNDRARLAKMIWRWEKIDPSDVEPAIKLHRKDSEHEEN
jgi:multidrug efflux pump subunit AcrB